VQNALNLAALAGHPDIPVACGRDTPLEGSRVFPQDWRDWSDSLAGVSIPANPNPPSNMGAVELLRDAIEAAPQDVEIITLGPLTNIAEAVQAGALPVDRVAGLYIMGGAFDVPGNLSDAADTGGENTAAEWNIYIDPHAAAIVVESGLQITFVPLDACNDVPLDEAFYNRLAADHGTPEAGFVYQVLTRNIGFVRSGSYYFWDPLTAALAVEESLGTFVTRPVIVVEDEGAEGGATRVAEGGMMVKIATGANAAQFEERFLDALNARLP
jgi:inosine-uridine nucleoside N-ribohydrolase